MNPTKKQCRFRDKYPIGGCLQAQSKEGCPKHTDDQCNIIPKRKPKPKLVKFKAWAHIGNNSGYTHAIARPNKTYEYTVPCTILIQEKYLEDKKKA